MDPRRYNLHPHEQQRVANYFDPGMPVDRLEEYDDFGAWKILKRTPTQWFMQHYNGAMMIVAVEGKKARSYELFLGDAAIDLEKQVKGGA